MPPISKVDIVVARYSEDVAWLGDVASRPELRDVELTIYIYDKGNLELPEAKLPEAKLHVTKLPNIGREAHTYLHRLEEHHGRYTEHTGALIVFVQGRIDDHLRDAHRHGHWSKCKTTDDVVVQLVQDAAMHDGISLGHAANHTFGSDSAHAGFKLNTYKGRPLDPVGDHTLGSWFQARLGRPWPQSAAWWVSAIFCIDAVRATSHSPSVYHALQADLQTEHPLAAHFMERAWAVIFD